MALRLEAMGQAKYAGTAKRVSDGRAVFTGKINLDEAALSVPARWKKPRRIFVNSMSDLFHEAVHPGFIYQVFKVMAETPQHTYQVLTKRPENIMPAMRLYGIGGATPQALSWPENVWIGTSVEDQAAADERIPHLLKVPARVRFLSCEPLLGPVDLTWLMRHKDERCPWCDSLIGGEAGRCYCGEIHEPLIHWVIAGGESGARARPMHPDWVRSLRDQCTEAGVSFFHKQNGEYVPYGHIGSLQQQGWDGDWTRLPLITDQGVQFVRVGKAAAGRLLDGREWDEVPE